MKKNRKTLILFLLNSTASLNSKRTIFEKALDKPRLEHFWVLQAEWIG